MGTRPFAELRTIILEEQQEKINNVYFPQGTGDHGDSSHSGASIRHFIQVPAVIEDSLQNGILHKFLKKKLQATYITTELLIPSCRHLQTHSLL